MNGIDELIADLENTELTNKSGKRGKAFVSGRYEAEVNSLALNENMRTLKLEVEGRKIDFGSLGKDEKVNRGMIANILYLLGTNFKDAMEGATKKKSMYVSSKKIEGKVIVDIQVVREGKQDRNDPNKFYDMYIVTGAYHVDTYQTALEYKEGGSAEIMANTEPPEDIPSTRKKPEEKKVKENSEEKVISADEEFED